MIEFKRMAAALVAICVGQALPAADKDLLPPNLTEAQRERLQSFLQQHAKPDRYMPANAKVVGDRPSGAEINGENAAKPVKQYMVQITSHRPVPGQEDSNRVDVYYYRPNPEAGKRGITVRHTVDLATGKQIGQTEVLLNAHTPVSSEELNEAVALAKDKSTAVQDLYKGRDEKSVRWEYLQLLIKGKREPHDPGDRVVRVVFTADAAQGQESPPSVPVIVNLTKGVVTAATR